MPPVQSRSSAKASLPCGPGPHEAAGDDHRHAGLLARFEVGKRTGHVARPGRRLESVPDLPHVSLPPPSRATLRSKTRRSPCKVSHGSWCWIISDKGVMRPASPPVAMIADGPSSSFDTPAHAVDEAGVAVDRTGLDRLDGRLADHVARLDELDAAQCSGVLEQRVHADLDPGRDRAAEVLARWPRSRRRWSPFPGRRRSPAPRTGRWRRRRWRPGRHRPPSGCRRESASRCGPPARSQRAGRRTRRAPSPCIAEVTSGTEEDTTMPSTPSPAVVPVNSRPTSLSSSVTRRAYSSAVRSSDGRKAPMVQQVRQLTRRSRCRRPVACRRWPVGQRPPLADRSERGAVPIRRDRSLSGCFPRREQAA